MHAISLILTWHPARAWVTLWLSAVLLAAQPAPLHAIHPDDERILRQAGELSKRPEVDHKVPIDFALVPEREIPESEPLGMDFVRDLLAKYGWHVGYYSLSKDGRVQRMALDIRQASVLGVLADLPALEVLIVGLFRAGTSPERHAVTFEPFTRMRTLRVLRFQPTSDWTVPAAEKVLQIPALEFLDVGSASGFASHVSLLKESRTLKHFMCEGCRFSSGELEQILKVKTLQAIDLNRSELKDADARTLSKYPNLRRVRIRGNHITDSGVKDLSNMINLVDLEVSGRITNRTSNDVKKLINLKQLRIEGALDNAALCDYADLPALELLNVGGSFTDEGVECLVKGRGLRSITLATGSGLSGRTLAALGKIRGLESITANVLTHKPGELRPLIGLPLRKYWVPMSGMTDADFRDVILTFRNLEVLTVDRRNGVTFESLMELPRLKFLSFVVIEKSQLTAQQESQLVKALPGVNIWFR